MKIKFIKSSVLIKDFPKHELPEVAIVGRSNAGKSSFINALAGKTIAKVSTTPGKTRLLNFFNVGESYCLVDMPGYGFAARSVSELNSWKKMIEDYLMNRESLVALLLVMDIRRNWTDDEQMIVDLMSQRDLPVIVVLNKRDKLNQSEFSKRKKALKESLIGMNSFPVSSTKKSGVKDVEEFVFNEFCRT